MGLYRIEHKEKGKKSEVIRAKDLAELTSKYKDAVITKLDEIPPRRRI